MTIHSTAVLPPTPPWESPNAVSADLGLAMHSSTSTKSLDKHMWIVSGPAGCGKSSVATSMHQTLGYDFLEGDAFHTAANIAKMSNGQPLTDTDRWDWLILLREQALRSLEATSGVIVTCSALKRKYRDVFRVASYHNPAVKVHFIFLNVPAVALLGRVELRVNHYMKQGMVASQLESLEMPSLAEQDVLVVDASGTADEVQDCTLTAVRMASSVGL